MTAPEGSDAAAIDRGFTLRHDLRPGDIGTIVQLHGTLYAREYGFDHTFEAYVAGPLARFALEGDDHSRIWIAERAGAFAGSIAIVRHSPTEAQLRWFLVVPEARGVGLGRRLVHEAVTFCRSCGYESVFLWTVAPLTTAASLYRAAGFDLVESQTRRLWGLELVEEKYAMRVTG